MLLLQIFEVIKFYNLGDKTFETDFNLIQKYIQSHQTVATINVSRVLPINVN